MCGCRCSVEKEQRRTPDRRFTVQSFRVSRQKSRESKLFCTEIVVQETPAVVLVLRRTKTWSIILTVGNPFWVGLAVLKF